MTVENRINNRKCTRCGLINFLDSVECRRCAATLGEPDGIAPSEMARPERARSASRRVTNGAGGGGRLLVLAATIATLLFLCHVSLLLTSEGLDGRQRELVGRAIALLEEQGFSREVVILRHLTSFRATDNWWNRSVGHGQAYAATNFPFEVVTLYPRFFDIAVDDKERAVILLHESHHLRGRSEEAALEDVWRSKLRLGWSVHAYGHTRVWRNTREWTQSSVPHLFTCGADGQSDCLE